MAGWTHYRHDNPDTWPQLDQLVLVYGAGGYDLAQHDSHTWLSADGRVLMGVESRGGLDWRFLPSRPVTA